MNVPTSEVVEVGDEFACTLLGNVLWSGIVRDTN